MCGRFVVARATADLAAPLGVDRVTEDDFEPSYNVAPTDSIPVAVDAKGTRRLELARWGLVPPWANDVSAGVRAINARSETAASKPTFRAAVKKRRAVIPVDGYYEWQKDAAGKKQPYFVHPTTDDLLLFAGLYEWWRSPDNEWLLSASILTRSSFGDEMTRLHDRMPVFLDHNDIDEWLDPEFEGDQHLVADFAERGARLAASLTMHPVGSRVGNVRATGADLIAPVTLDVEG